MDLSKSEDRKKLFMLCNSIDENSALQLKDNYYVGQLKRDGERIIAVVINGKPILINRRGKICNLHFEEVVEDLKQLPNCIIDGEIISVDDDFSKLMSRAMTKTPSKLRALQKEIPISYEVFDILGDDTTTNKIHLPLKDRIIELENLFFGKEFKHTTLLPNLPISVALQQAKDNEGEGIIVKDLNGKYECGKRSHNWKKLKFFKEVDIIVTTYTSNNAGIRVETEDKNTACQISGEQHEEVKELLDRTGQAEITIQYLSQSQETKKYRFPSYKKLVVK